VDVDLDFFTVLTIGPAMLGVFSDRCWCADFCRSSLFWIAPANLHPRQHRDGGIVFTSGWQVDDCISQTMNIADRDRTGVASRGPRVVEQSTDTQNARIFVAAVASNRERHQAAERIAGQIDFATINGPAALGVREHGFGKSNVAIFSLPKGPRFPKPIRGEQ